MKEQVTETLMDSILTALKELYHASCTYGTLALGYITGDSLTKAAGLVVAFFTARYYYYKTKSLKEGKKDTE